jgi:hypothetical protein
MSAHSTRVQHLMSEAMMHTPLTSTVANGKNGSNNMAGIVKYKIIEFRFTLHEFNNSNAGR